MINRFKTFAIAMMVTGATVATTQATVKTNEQVLENISLQFKVYSQGVLTGGGTSASAPTTLPATVKSFTTSDLIRQLAIITSNAFTYDKTDKLVRSTQYSNLVANTGAFTSTTILNIPFGAFTKVSYVGILGGTNNLFFGSAATPITYYITNSNGHVYLYESGDNTDGVFVTVNYDTLTNNILLTNSASTHYGVVTNLTTNLVADSYGSFSSWTTIESNAAGNLVVTLNTPITVPIYTNVPGSQHIAVLTSKTSTPASALIPVDNWVKLVDLGSDIVDATGKQLSGDLEDNGTNLTSASVFTTKEINIDIVYPTNNPPPTQTNLVFAGLGFDKEVGQVINLTVGGKATNAEKFTIFGTETMPSVAAYGFENGQWTANPTVTNTFNGITSTNNNTRFSAYWGTNDTIFVQGYIQLPTNITITGSVSITQLPSELTPLEP